MPPGFVRASTCTQDHLLFQDAHQVGRGVEPMRGGKTGDSAKAVAKAVSSAGRKLRSRKGRSTSQRVDVVGEKLCDGVVKYLAPTLEQHRACTLIDFNPGLCQFSAKLHDFLKPRLHILVEPEDTYFESSIKPLLDKPGSKYRHVVPGGVSPSAQWYSLRSLQKEDPLFVTESERSKASPGQKSFDPNLLVIGNLARDRQGRVFDKTVELVPLALHQLGYDVLGNECFQAGGLVRMLWWLPEMYKPMILPCNQPYKRSSFNVGLDMGLGISEVAGVTPTQTMMDSRTENYSPRRRLDTFDATNAQTVAKNMNKLGIIVPEGSRLQQTAYKAAVPKSSADSLSPFAHTADSTTTLQAKIHSMSSRLSHQLEWLNASSRVSSKQYKTIVQDAMDTIEYPQCTATHRHPRQGNREASIEKVAVLFDLGLRLMHLEASVKDLEEKGTAKYKVGELRDHILSLDRDFNELLEDVSHKTSDMVLDLMEDQLAFYSSSPLMTWDRRSYEPLQAEKSDFSPDINLTLLDLMPKNIDLSVPGLADSGECSRVCAELLKNLFSSRNQPLPSALDKIGVNAAKDLIPMVPAITDVRKGGRLNPENLTIRMVTTEMIEGLVKAFYEWPFRPQNWEMNLMHGEVEGMDKSEKPKTEVAFTD